MKFDKIIMNPPYKGSLHLKILSEAIQHANEIVNLSPIRWLQDPLHDLKSNTDYDKFAHIRNRIDELEVLNVETMAGMFWVNNW